MELAVVTPFFIFLILGGFEMANYQMLKGDVLHTVRTVGRQLSVGEMQIASAATAVNAELVSWGGVPLTGITESTTDITLTVSVPISSVPAFTFLDSFVGKAADASLTFRKEKPSMKIFRLHNSTLTRPIRSAR